MTGSLALNSSGHLMTPTECQMRAQKEWGIKMGLLRKFDCEHLSFLLGTQPDRILSESLLGSKIRVRIPTFLPGLQGEPVAIQWDPRGFPDGIWGFHLNGLGGKNPIQAYSISGKIWTNFTEKATSPRVLRWQRTFSN